MGPVQSATATRVVVLLRYGVPMTEQDQRVDAGALPPLAPPGASDSERHDAIVARMVTRFGAPTLAQYRRVYQACGLDWPGDDEIRRRHPVADAAA